MRHHRFHALSSGVTLVVLGIAGCRGPGPPRSASAPGASGWPAPPPFFAGVALGLFGHPSDPDAAERDIAAIASIGATGVVLPVFWRSEDIRATAIVPFSYGVSQAEYDRSTIEIARRAHDRGLAFALLPIVQLERLTVGEWRGTLRPDDWEAWWRSYTAFILHHARIAAEARAELLSVGSELGSTEHDRERWAGLIRAVRRIYPGRLIYSANWDHFEEVRFWDLLDGVGLSAYYELATRADAPQEELDAAWAVHRDRILAWARTEGKPVYLTEVGYPARAGAAVHPWDYTQDEPVDVAAQERCYLAFARAWEEPAELAGVTIWLWEHDKGGPADPSYAIAGKPAEAVVARFFAARRARAAR